MKRSSSFVRMLSSLLAIILVFGGTPALAADAQLSNVQAPTTSSTSEFDFSEIDDIDKFDTYERKSDDICSDYVGAGATNSIDELNPRPINYARYGAFVRSQGEVQKYRFFNIPPSSAVKTPGNVLTVYADPEAKFTVMTHDGQMVIDSNGKYDSAKVKYYKRSTEGKKVVYYIDLVPQKVGLSSNYFIEFTTDSTTVQPHYSFWFGAPLTRRGVADGGAFNISLAYPNTSGLVSVRGPGMIPDRSWVSKVKITRTSVIGGQNVTYAKFGLTLPNNRRLVDEKMVIPTTTISAGLNEVTASPAKGNYTLNLNGARWEIGTKPGAKYVYMGQLSVEYLYAFGA